MPTEDKIRELERKLEEQERLTSALLDLIKKSGTLTGQLADLEKLLHNKISQIKQTGDKASQDADTLRKLLSSLK